MANFPKIQNDQTTLEVIEEEEVEIIKIKTTESGELEVAEDGE